MTPNIDRRFEDVAGIVAVDVDVDVVAVAAVVTAVGIKIARMCYLSKDFRFASEELKYVNTIG